MVVLGIPPEVERQFEPKFAKLGLDQHVELLVLSARSLHHNYTEKYAKSVYEKLVYKLRGLGKASRETLLADTNLIILFLQRPCGNEDALFEQFGVEGFVTPMLVPGIMDMPMGTPGQRGDVVNKLIKSARRAILHAEGMLRVISDEVSKRENKTCLLLPPKTFGDGFLKVRSRIWDAAMAREDSASFARSLKFLNVSKSGSYFEGKGRLVYEPTSRPDLVMEYRRCGRTITSRYASSVGGCDSEHPTIHTSTTIARYRMVRIGDFQDAMSHCDCRQIGNMPTVRQTIMYVEIDRRVKSDAA